VFSSPFLQRFVIAAFGFDDFAGVRFFVDFYLTRLTSDGLGLSNWCATTGLRIKQVDHVRQAVTVFSEQSAKLRFELNFFLEASVAFQRLESLELFGKVFFELAEFSELGLG
jgi:hypothetical protein